jgi:hypothetical protein
MPAFKIAIKIPSEDATCKFDDRLIPLTRRDRMSAPETFFAVESTQCLLRQSLEEPSRHPSMVEILYMKLRPGMPLIGRRCFADQPHFAIRENFHVVSPLQSRHAWSCWMLETAA